MKKLILLTAVSAFAIGNAAFAGHHEDGEKGKHHKGNWMFEKNDTNKDGVISKDEFIANATERFSKMDTDDDGNITKEEAKKHKGEMKEKHKEMRKKHKETKGDEYDEDDSDE